MSHSVRRNALSQENSWGPEHHLVQTLAVSGNALRNLSLAFPFFSFPIAVLNTSPRRLACHV